jgi:branched-chain amino acid transport system ATP-binding protein
VDVIDPEPERLGQPDQVLVELEQLERPVYHRAALALLSVENVDRSFGGILALDEVSFEVPEGQIVGLIGPNGAGKTTAFNVITRLYKADSGQILFAGKNILRVSPHRIIRLGIARTFQNVELFSGMTVLENVLVGAHTRFPWFRAGESRKQALEVIDYVGLGGQAMQPAQGLPFGTLKRIELARALVSGPKLLLLDEPAGGLNHEEVSALGDFIERTRDDFGLTILLVEHHMNLVMRISQTVHVLDFGRLIASGSPEVVRRDPAVIEAYLGPEKSDAAA